MKITQDMIRKLLKRFRYNQDIELMEEVSENKEIMMALMKKDIFIYRRASLDIRADKDLALKVLKIQGILLDSVAPELANDKEVVLTAVSNYGYALEYASDKMKDDRDVVIAAIKQYPRALTFASPRLRRDKELINYAFKLGGPFIVEPIAFKVFEKVGSEMSWREEHSPRVFKKDKIYSYCAKFYNGKITGTEMMEFQDLLLKKVSDFNLEDSNTID